MMKRGSTPALTEAQVADIRKMRDAKAPIAQIADAYGVNHMTIRRALEPTTYPKPKPPKREQEYVRRLFTGDAYEKQAPKFRITDYHDSLTAYLCGDPTPQRRCLMEEGRI